MDTVFLALRVVVSLGAVFGALFVAHRWLTKGRPGRGRPGASIKVVARQGLGGKTGVALVEADGRRYLLGVTEQAVTVLDSLDAPRAAPRVEPSHADTYVQIVATGPIPRQAGAATPFDREFAAVTMTASIPLVPAEDAVPDLAADPDHEVLRIERSDSGAIPVPVPLTRREARAAEAAAAASAAATEPASKLAGSILSPATWKQTAAAIRSLR